MIKRYNAVEDPLCYPGTQVLRNKGGYQDAEALEEFEEAMFEIRAQEDLPLGELDYAHYRAIHRHFFQDVYDWAGETRQIRTSKGNSPFCYPENIEAQMNQLLSQLAQEGHLGDFVDPDAFADRAAHYIAEINAVHPFREGNGRCQLALLVILTENVGFTLDQDKLDPKAWMEAMIESFSGSKDPLAAEIRKLIE